MKLMLAECDVEIEYHARFEGVIEEHEDRVTFRINGREEDSSMLVGTDGIYSSVRKYIAPDIKPEYTGVLGVLAHIHRNTVKWPYPDFEPACTIQGKPGAFFTIPEDPDAKEIMVGMQVRHPDQSRAEWEAMSADKEKMADYYRAGYDEWHDTARQIIDQVCASKESLYLWPFLRMPKIDKWYSRTGRVLLVGDAAHAIPPSSGQGVNQALEDVYGLTLILARSSDLLSALAKWQAIRQKRIDAVFDWATNGTNVQRLPEAERQKLIAENKSKNPNASNDFDDMRWLYQLNLEDEVGPLAG
jgi:2-polyprenyl-6-methoxyphenol hydroxylase-like FAD-dependent oxidoreductase